MKWLWKKFDQLSPREVYEISKLRQKVFVVEQNCAYLDADDFDLAADHLLVLEEDSNQLVGYARITTPGSHFKTEYSLGRVVTAPETRGTGLGKEITAKALQFILDNYKTHSVRISAQAYLENFYQKFGFERTGKEYEEDGIPHIEMQRH